MLSVLTLALAAFSAPVAPAPAPAALIASWVRGSSLERPRVNIWLNKDDVYNRGDRARVYFKSDQDAYVTIVRIDTDGRLRVLFPIDPWEDNFARGGKTFEVLGRDRDEAFRIDDYPGVGYVFAIASEDPFTYDDLIRGDHWDYHTISDGRVRGDPYVTVSDIADKIAREDDYDYDVSQYYVEKHYDYPRFVCYDCHTYTSWRAWDPYGSYCSRFRIVVYDDWYYYPYRYRNGGTVIVRRPYRPGPRYVFKDADQRNDYVTRVAERPRSDADNRRPIIERDRTSADVGGRGAIPAPVSPRRPAPDGGDRAGVTGEPRRSPETRQPANDGRPATPESNRGEPRRRTDPDRPRDPGNTREVPPSSSGESPRRRPSDDRSTQQGQPDRDRPDAPQTREPSRREPARAPDQREPSRQDRPQDQPRAEPRQSPPPRAEPRQAPPPRSTGEPQLKRRRP